MSDDWKAGDVAVCVDLAPDAFGNVPSRLRLRQTYRVARVVCAADAAGPDTFVQIKGKAVEAGKNGYRSWRFRRLNDEPDNIALIERIKRPQPAKETANV